MPLLLEESRVGMTGELVPKPILQIPSNHPHQEVKATYDTEVGIPMIDQMQRRSGPGICEICGRHPATKKAKFNAQYVQSSSIAIFEEENVVGVELTKRVCEECSKALQEAKNVTDLTFDRL
jgi:hypothetical protein